MLLLLLLCTARTSFTGKADELLSLLINPIKRINILFLFNECRTLVHVNRPQSQTRIDDTLKTSPTLFNPQPEFNKIAEFYVGKYSLLIEMVV